MNLQTDNCVIKTGLATEQTTCLFVVCGNEWRNKWSKYRPTAQNLWW